MTKSTITKEAEQALKAKAKMEKASMPKPSKRYTILTVLITVGSLALVGGIFYTGFTYGQKYENGLNVRVQSEVKTAKQAAISLK